MAAKIASAAERAPAPVGSRFCEWSYGRSYYGKTGVVGVLEVFTHESKHPNNRRFGLASPGDFVIRHLKKDGTPSLNYTRWSVDCPHGWFPEGVDPNKKAPGG